MMNMMRMKLYPALPGRACAAYDARAQDVQT